MRDQRLSLRMTAVLAVGILAMAACDQNRASAPVTESPASNPAPSPATPSERSPEQNQSSVALPAGYEIVSNVLPPSESYLPGADSMPTGVVLLDAGEGQKNRQLCAALLGERTATVRTEAEARRDDPQGDYLVTHWLSRTPVTNEGDCQVLIAAYDFERAKRIKQTYGLEGRRGPLFLALDPSGEIVFLDLSDASPDEVFRATADWMNLALKAGDALEAPPARGLSAAANHLFARIASGFGTLARVDTAPSTIDFNDPVSGVARAFTVYRSGVFRIGATFQL